VKLTEVIDELVEERGLDRSILSGIVCEGMLRHTKKSILIWRSTLIFDKKTNEMVVLIEKSCRLGLKMKIGRLRFARRAHSMKS